MQLQSIYLQGPRLRYSFVRLRTACSPWRIASAAAVRIKFMDDKAGMLMAIHDPELVLTARRKQ